MACNVEMVPEITAVKEKANAVGFEIQGNERPAQLKPLPAGLLNRMMVHGNSNKFEFMKNPNFKSGSFASMSSRSNSSRQTAGSMKMGSTCSNSFRSLAGTMTETQEAAVIKAAAKAACRDVEAEDESGSERVATASTSTSNEARRISAGLDLRSDEGVASARSPHSSDEATSPDQASSGNAAEPPVVPEVEMVEEKTTCVGFNITFSPEARGPRKNLVKRLKQRTPGAPQKKKRAPAAADDEGDADAELSSPTSASTSASTSTSTTPGVTTNRYAAKAYSTKARKGKERTFEGMDPAEVDRQVAAESACETPKPPSTPCSPHSSMSPRAPFSPQSSIMSPWTQPGSPRREKQVIGVGVGIEDQPEKELLEPECLGDEERERCDQWIKLLGLHTVKCLFSKHWQHRADGIKKVMQTLRKYSTAKLAFRAKLFMVFASIVERRLADNVLQVYQATGDVLKSLVDFGEGMEETSMREAMDLIIPVLLKRAGDANQRICSIAEELLYWLAAQEDLKGLQYIANFITKPIPDANKAYKHVVARLKVITHLVTEYGLQPNKEDGLSAESVNRFTLDVVETVNRRVCQDAAAVVKMLYRQLGLKAIHLLNVQVKDNASEDYLQRALGPLILELISELASPDRSRPMQASDSLLALAMHEKVGTGFVAKYVQQPPEDLYNTAALSSRLNFMTRMVATLGFSTTALKIEQVMLYAVPGIQSEFEEVRKAANNLVFACHNKAGDDVWQYLVAQDDAYVQDLKKRVIMNARNQKGSFARGRLNAEVGLARAQDRTVAFGGSIGERR